MKNGFEILNASPTRSQSRLIQAVDLLIEGFHGTGPEFFDEALGRLAANYGKEIYSEFLNALFHVQVSADKAQDVWAGILDFHRTFERQVGHPLDFRVSALQYLISVAKLLGNPIIIEADQYQKVFHDTVTDELTGLFNYRCFQTSLIREVERTHRYHEPLSLLFFDLDHFKVLNDKHGHAAGDQALKLLSAAILSSIRTTDLPCRYGGDEFAVIAVSTSKEGAGIVADRIRKKLHMLASLSWKFPETPLVISGGIATCPQDAMQPEQLLRKADDALYLAKKSGRNHVETSGSERRRYPRKDMIASGIFMKGASNQCSVIIKNVSEGGFLVHTTEAVERGNIAELEVTLDRGKPPIQCMGKVAHVATERVGKGYSFGFEIVAMSKEHARNFMNFVSAA